MMEYFRNFSGFGSVFFDLGGNSDWVGIGWWHVP